ncbi:flagellar biosynthetic protein FlhB [Natranaerovirga pectinivora]|uniref:Flagellar biosynthetic protein FlhB n=1 Tax=Natranaerovirga pectinivora TaxID=682400 RepID=A0A4R3MM04_9FIRM|nr:flagellar biosynthesis protein FlhB [Natranaerovirga pectinivora]TCT15086.1 flagellar biosynthetic protein FlhB [Natranaerovirga pectinivora]
MRKFKKPILSYNLQFFADGPSGEKTEKPTSRKREKAREEGQVVKSIEVNTAFLLIALFAAINWIIPSISSNIIHFMNDIYLKFNVINNNNFSIDFVTKLMIESLWLILRLVAPIFLIAVLLGLGLNFLQVGFKITPKALKPKFSKLNPIQGFKKIFSLRSLFELVKSLLKISLILAIVYSTIRGKEKTLLVLYDMSLNQIIVWTGSLAIEIGIKVGVFFIFVALADYIYQKLKHEKELKMTKQEIKDEHKMTEGNPEIKSKIRQKMREASMRRMMQELPKADVIITNPTHFAVAIQYNAEISSAPLVIAKGTDFVAAKIREKATENGIEIIENKPLARTLYYTVDIGDAIPEELYQAVAEVLAFVYSLKQTNNREA